MFAASGALAPLSAASLTEPVAVDPIGASPAAPEAIDKSQHVVPISPPVVDSSAADRLRGDAVQTARVPVGQAVEPLPPQAQSQPPVKLTSEQRTVARYIARSHRVASESIDRFVYYAFKAGIESRLAPHLILAVMAVESGFNPAARSAVGAQGLMQIHTRVHSRKFAPFGGDDAAYDPLANIKVGAGILSEYVKRHGDVAAGLKAYVGAALRETDGGYGSKVLRRQAEFDAVVRAEAGTEVANAEPAPAPGAEPAPAPRAEPAPAPEASLEAASTTGPDRVSVGL